MIAAIVAGTQLRYRLKGRDEIQTEKFWSQSGHAKDAQRYMLSNGLRDVQVRSVDADGKVTWRLESVGKADWHELTPITTQY